MPLLQPKPASATAVADDQTSIAPAIDAINSKLHADKVIDRLFHDEKFAKVREDIESDKKED